MFAAIPEILIPHDFTLGPVIAVRRALVQYSLLELLRLGVHDRYARVADAETLTEMADSAGQGWMSMTSALKHYRACEELGLTEAQTETHGEQVGRRFQRALFVSPSRSSVVAVSLSRWASIDELARACRRTYQGGSVEYVKVAENELRIESAQNLLFASPFFRITHVWLLRCALSSVGQTGVTAKLTNYCRESSKLEALVSWPR